MPTLDKICLYPVLIVRLRLFNVFHPVTELELKTDCPVPGKKQNIFRSGRFSEGGVEAYNCGNNHS